MPACDKFSTAFLSHPATRFKTAAQNSFGTVCRAKNVLHNNPNKRAQTYFSC